MQVVTQFRTLFAVVCLACSAAGTVAQLDAPAPPMPPLPGDTESAHPLVWDSMLKEYSAAFGEVSHQFTFWVTNTGPQDVTITEIHPSCGCTATALPQMPWKLAPKESGKFDASMNFAGKIGALAKTIAVASSAGYQTLTVKVVVPPPDPNMDERTRNQLLAKADRQAVFRGECFSCHAAKGYGKFGEELYRADCGICHDAEHRAEMVPDLAALKHPADANYWRNWIANGREGSLMPAFARDHGGPLSPQQIDSLVEYLLKKHPDRVPRNAAPAEAASGGGK